MLVGTLATPKLLSSPHAERAEYVSHIVGEGIDHVFVADHVSFHVGTGMDGLINAATLTALNPALKVCVGVYLLALRNPVIVSRQLATLAESAPGQLILGIGVGGEDRNEIAMVGVDPATRGRRTDECLAVLKGLQNGEQMDFDGEFFSFKNAWIKPHPQPEIPIVIGGRAEASLSRAARYGDGWLGIWSTAERYAKVIHQVEKAASALHRPPLHLHGLQVWAGIDNDRDHARARLAKAMQNFYRVPYERFEKYSPFGTAAEVAQYLAPYRDAGCRLFNIMPVAESETAGIAAVAEIRRRLSER